MSSENEVRLLYEWNAKYAQLDFAIHQAEHQLTSVNKRLKGLWHDLAVYSAMLVLPWLMLQFLRFFMESRSVIQPFLVIIHHVLMCIYAFSLPFVIYDLIKTIAMIRKNREQENEFEQPPLKGELHGQQPEREPTYRMEQKKLIYILTRYYWNQDLMKQPHKRITASVC